MSFALNTTRGMLLAAAIACAMTGCGSRTPAPTSTPSAMPGGSNDATGAPGPIDAAPQEPPATSKTADPTEPALDRERAAVGELLAADGSGGWRVDEKAATEVERLAMPPDSLLRLLDETESLEVRRGAAYLLLAAFDRESPEQVAALQGLLDAEDAALRGFGVAAAGQMQRSDQAAAAPLLAALLKPEREPRPESRSRIARLLGSFKADAAAATDALQACAASDPDSTVRSAALVALTHVAAPAQAAQALGDALSDKEPAVRLVAAKRLLPLGPDAAPAAVALAKTLSDDDPAVAEAAAAALIACGEPSVAPLIRQLQGESASARKLALACLARIGPKAKVARSAVEQCKQDPDPIVRQLAEAASRRIGQP